MANELFILLFLEGTFYTIMKQVDIFFVVLIHACNLVYYYIKCRQFSLCVLSIIELINVSLSLLLVAILFIISPNISVAAVNNIRNTGLIVVLVLSEFVLMLSIYL